MTTKLEADWILKVMAAMAAADHRLDAREVTIIQSVYEELTGEPVDVSGVVSAVQVYARKDAFYKEKGIALVANATKLEAQTQDPTADDPNVETPLWYALNAFLDNYNYGPFPAPAGYQQGYESAVAAIKAHEAIMNKTRIEFDPAWFELG